MADATASITEQVTAAVTTVVAQPQVEAKMSAVPAIVEALAPLIMALVNARATGPWYSSKAVWAAFISLLVPILGVFGLAFPAEMQTQALIVIMAAIPLVTAVIGLVGHFRAKKPLV